MQLARYVKFREEQFGGVLFETQTEKVYTLNPSATAILREVRSGGDVGEIVARLKIRFRDPSGTIEQDVMALIADLRQKGLLQGAPE
jgi:hypothetical protein